MRAIDSNLLVYAALEDHPAHDACRECLLAEPQWITNEANLSEVYTVLVAVYGVPEQDASAHYLEYHGALTPMPLDATTAVAAMRLREHYGLDLNDAILLHTAIACSVEALCTDDQRLAAAAQNARLEVESPVGVVVRRAMATWEEQHLPVKGLPRMLSRVHEWLRSRDAGLAAELRSATRGLSSLP